MNLHDSALALAGVIGIGVAGVHAVLVHRLMVKPRAAPAMASPELSAIVDRLTPTLLQFSTFNWMVGGVVLIVAASGSGQEFRTAAGVLVGSSYLYGAMVNLWATRRVHPGWVLYGLAVALIVFALEAGR